MDDTYLPGDSVTSCQRNVQHTVQLIQELGFNINETKSVLLPTQSLEFLGYILDSLTMTITLTSRRKTNIKEVCQKLLSNSSHKIRFVSAVIGMIIAALPAVKYGALHYRPPYSWSHLPLFTSPYYQPAEGDIMLGLPNLVMSLFGTLTLCSYRV